MTSSSTDFLAEYEKAEMAYNQGNYEDAASIICEVLMEDPENARARLLCGHIYCYGLEQYDVAREQYQAVLGLTDDPDLSSHAEQGITYTDNYLDASDDQVPSFDEESDIEELADGSLGDLHDLNDLEEFDPEHDLNGNGNGNGIHARNGKHHTQELAEDLDDFGLDDTPADLDDFDPEHFSNNHFNSNSDEEEIDDLTLMDGNNPFMTDGEELEDDLSPESLLGGNPFGIDEPLLEEELSDLADDPLSGDLSVHEMDDYQGDHQHPFPLEEDDMSSHKNSVDMEETFARSLQEIPDLELQHSLNGNGTAASQNGYQNGYQAEDEYADDFDGLDGMEDIFDQSLLNQSANLADDDYSLAGQNGYQNGHQTANSDNYDEDYDYEQEMIAGGYADPEEATLITSNGASYQQAPSDSSDSFDDDDFDIDAFGSPGFGDDAEFDAIASLAGELANEIPPRSNHQKGNTPSNKSGSFSFDDDFDDDFFGQDFPDELEGDANQFAGSKNEFSDEFVDDEFGDFNSNYPKSDGDKFDDEYDDENLGGAVFGEDRDGEELTSSLGSSPTSSFFPDDRDSGSSFHEDNISLEHKLPFTKVKTEAIDTSVTVEQGGLAFWENATLRSKHLYTAMVAGFASVITVALVSYTVSYKSLANKQPETIVALRQTSWLMSLSAGMASFLTVWGLGTVTSKQIEKSHGDLQNQFDALSEGNLRARASVYSEDELGHLAAKFNHMAKVIQSTYTDAQRKAEDNEQEKENLQRQVIRLLDDVEGAARGDLTVSAEVTADVLGAVADSFNLIIQNLREIVYQVKEAAKKVGKGSMDSATFAQGLSLDTLRQAEELAATLNSVQVMTDAIQRVAENAKETENVARTAAALALKGGETVDKTVSGILEIREGVADATRRVKRLAEYCQEISKVVGSISSIAGRTNLLALNASIEAARAGEAGKGFAVVADEVRQLADKSAKESKNIERTVMQIQAETSGVMTQMEEATQHVVSGTKLAEQAKRALDDIVQVTTRIDVLVRSIAADTVEQNEVAQSVSKVMQAVELTAQETSQESQRVSNSLQNLVGVARDLLTSVERFKVENIDHG